MVERSVWKQSDTVVQILPGWPPTHGGVPRGRIMINYLTSAVFSTDNCLISLVGSTITFNGYYFKVHIA